MFKLTFMDLKIKVQYVKNHVKSRQITKFTANAKIHGLCTFCEFVIFVEPFRYPLTY